MATVTRRLSFNQLRGQKRRDHRERDVARDESLPSSQEIAERVEIETRLLAVLDGLGEPHRTVLRDRYLGDLTPAQIAQRDGTSLNTIKSRLSRARAAMRERLEREGLGDEVHWSIVVAPLLDPQGAWVGAPTAFGAGSTLSAASAIGGTLLMKKALALALLLLIGSATWQWVQPPDQEPLEGHTQAAVAPETKTDLLPVEATIPEVNETSERQVADRSMDEAQLSAEEETRTWRLAGRARIGRTDADASGVTFDVEVHAGYDEDGPLLHAESLVSGADGRFEWLLEDPGRTVTITIDARDVEDRAVVTYGPYLVVAGEEPPWLDSLVFPIDGWLAGNVRDARGAPVAGALVKGLYGETETTLDGTYEMRIATGSWGETTATAPGHGGDSRQFQDLVAGEVARADFTLTEAIRIQGIVADESGAPIAGARVRTSGNIRDETVSDPAGRYELTRVAYVPGESVRMSVRADGFGTVGLSLGVEQGQREYEQDFELRRGVPVRGRLEASDGRPVAGAEVWIGPQPHSWDGSTAISGDDGRFLFSSVARGRLQAGATKDGFAPVQIPVTIPEHGSANEIHLQFPVARAVRGVVRDEEGLVLAGISVAARQNSNYVGGTSRTNAQGEFEVGELPPGRIRLEAYGSGYVRTTVHVASHEDEAEIVMPPAGKISGRAIDAATGEALKAFTVRFIHTNDPNSIPRVTGFNANWSRPGRTFHDDDGRWSTGKYDELEVGAWVGVEIRADGYARSLFDVQVLPESAESTLVHELEQPVSVEVLLSIEGSAAPVAGAAIQATTQLYPQEQDLRWSATSDATGSALLEGVSPGPLHVTVTRPSGPPLKYGPFEIAAAPARSVLPVQLPLGRTLEVLLRDESGQLLPHRDLRLSSTIEGSGHVTLRGRTNESGLARIEQVPAGRWQVSQMLEDGAFQCSWLTSHVEVTENDKVARIELAPPGHTVARGTVVADGPLPPGCTVSALSRDGAPNHGAFVRDGEFELRGLARGTYLVSLTYWDVGTSSMFAGHAELVVGENDRELTLEVEVKPMDR